jgi:hypothetical protein
LSKVIPRSNTFGFSRRKLKMHVNIAPHSDAEIKTLDEVIKAMETVLEDYKKRRADIFRLAGIEPPEDTPARQQSYVQLAIAVLEELGRPTPITVLLERIRERRNDPTITRGSVETSLLRHLTAKGDNTEFVKPCPGTYALKQHLDGLR